MCVCVCVCVCVCNNNNNYIYISFYIYLITWVLVYDNMFHAVLLLSDSRRIKTV